MPSVMQLPCPRGSGIRGRSTQERGGRADARLFDPCRYLSSRPIEQCGGGRGVLAQLCRGTCTIRLKEPLEEQGRLHLVTVRDARSKSRVPEIAPGMPTCI